MDIVLLCGGQLGSPEVNDPPLDKGGHLAKYLAAALNGIALHGRRSSSKIQKHAKRFRNS
jgi:hypothetical protein